MRLILLLAIIAIFVLIFLTGGTNNKIYTNQGEGRAGPHTDVETDTDIEDDVGNQKSLNLSVSKKFKAGVSH